jgi:hypothetical protein
MKSPKTALNFTALNFGKCQKEWSLLDIFFLPHGPRWTVRRMEFIDHRQ